MAGAAVCEQVWRVCSLSLPVDFNRVVGVITLFNRLFTWIASPVDPFPVERPAVPPPGLVAFCWHYTRPFWPLLPAATLLSASIALLEMFLFAFLGDLVDILAGADRANFWQQHGDRLLWMAGVALLGAALGSGITVFLMIWFGSG